MSWLYPQRKLSAIETLPDRVVFTVMRVRRPSDVKSLYVLGSLTLVLFLAGILIDPYLFLFALFPGVMTACAWWGLYREKPQIFIADEKGFRTRWRLYPWSKMRGLHHGYGQKGWHGLKVDRGFWLSGIVVPWIDHKDCDRITKAIHTLFHGKPYGRPHPRIH